MAEENKVKDLESVSLLKLIFALVDIGFQRQRNCVLTNGNNNEVHVPMEEGFGANNMGQ